jgi:hypothetical protein
MAARVAVHRKLPHRVIVSAAVTVELRDTLRRLADAGDRTVSAEIRRALCSHVEKGRP